MEERLLMSLRTRKKLKNKRSLAGKTYVEFLVTELQELRMDMKRRGGMESNETLRVLRTAQQGKTGPGHKAKNKQPRLMANRSLNKL
jgi:hypothetical protein